MLACGVICALQWDAPWLCIYEPSSLSLLHCSCCLIELLHCLRHAKLVVAVVIARAIVRQTTGPDPRRQVFKIIRIAAGRYAHRGMLVRIKQPLRDRVVVKVVEEWAHDGGAVRGGVLVPTGAFGYNP